jgi:16S rRNA G1207 methylase RsmC
LRKAPSPPGDGSLLDLGCGYGPIALSLAVRSPAADVWAVDVNERALGLVHESAVRNELHNVHATTPDGVPPTLEFAAIYSNPPIRIGKDALQALLLQWLPRLRQGGVAWLVVGRNLGADSLHQWLVAQRLDVQRAASSKGYRVLRVQR